MDVLLDDKNEIGRNFLISTKIVDLRRSVLRKVENGNLEGETDHTERLAAFVGYHDARKRMVEKSADFLAIGAHKDDDGDFKLSAGLRARVEFIDNWIETEFGIRQGRDATLKERAVLYKTLQVAVDDPDLFRHMNISLDDNLPAYLPIDQYNKDNLVDYVNSKNPVHLYKVAKRGGYIDEYSEVFPDGSRQFGPVEEQAELIERFEGFTERLKDMASYHEDIFDQDLRNNYDFLKKHNIPDFHSFRSDTKNPAWFYQGEIKLISLLEQELKISDERLRTSKQTLSVASERGGASVGSLAVARSSSTELSNAAPASSYQAGPSLPDENGLNSKRKRDGLPLDPSPDEPAPQRLRTEARTPANMKTDEAQLSSGLDKNEEMENTSTPPNGPSYDDRSRGRNEGVER